MGAAGLAALALGACGVSYADPAGPSDSAAASAASSSASPTSSASPSPSDVVSPDAGVYKDCVGVLDIKPTSVTWSCGNPAATVTDIRWTSWGQLSATATGTLTAKGGATSTAAIELSDPTGSDHHYSTLTVTPKKGKPQIHKLT